MSKSGLKLVTLYLALSSFISTIAKAEDASQIISKYNVVWNSPSTCSNGSMPIGNGDMGLNVWFEENGDLLVYVSKGDTWSENARILKLGKLRISFSPNPYKNGCFFHQELELLKGTISIQTGNKENALKIKIWVDAYKPAAYIECDSNSPIEIMVQTEPWRTQPREVTGQELHSFLALSGAPRKIIVEPDTIVKKQDSLLWYHRNNRSVWEECFKVQGLESILSKEKDPLLNLTFGCSVSGDNLISVDETQLKTFSPTKKTVIAIKSHTAQTDTIEKWIDELEQVKIYKNQNELKSAYSKHTEWWQNFWDRSRIIVTGSKDADTVTQGCLLARWMDACAGRGNFPIKFNGSIFTVDANTSIINPEGHIYDADYRLWGSAYWWQNTRLIYWPMLNFGDFDLMQPLFNMYMKALPLAMERTKIYYNHSGAFFPETMQFWGTYTNADFGWNREGKLLGAVDNPWIKYYWQGGIELVTMMIAYYEYTNDDNFARTKLLPMSEQILFFYAQHWPKDESCKILFKPSASLETWHIATNPLPEIAGLKYVLNKLIALKPSLIKSHRKQWQQMLDSLPPIPMKEENGKKFLLPADSFESKNNMENPELYAIFPYGLYGVGKPDLDIARETYSRRLMKASGCWHQDAIDAACLGLADEAWKYVVYNFSTKHAAYLGASGENLAAAIKSYGTLTDPNVRFPGFWGPNYDWIPDQDHPGVTMIALQRMLMQTDGEKIILFPAWPKNLDVEFKLNAPHNTVIEAALKNGKIIKLNVKPASRKKDISIIYNNITKGKYEN